MTAGYCPWPEKAKYRSLESACQGALTIQARVEARGEEYTPLYPYECAEEDHWHLSHYPQGFQICPRCREYAQAWWGGKIWRMGAHRNENGESCAGFNQKPLDPDERLEA